ncbi:MAG TPA: hypothetical protein VD999_04900 [Vitreimonas sp.]|nr:hypothetical protein [Vitreimonas sp.]
MKIELQPRELALAIEQLRNLINDTPVHWLSALDLGYKKQMGLPSIMVGASNSLKDFSEQLKKNETDNLSPEEEQFAQQCLQLLATLRFFQQIQNESQINHEVDNDGMRSLARVYEGDIVPTINTLFQQFLTKLENLGLIPRVVIHISDKVAKVGPTHLTNTDIDTYFKTAGD